MCVCDPTFSGKNCDFAITTLQTTTTAMPVATVMYCHFSLDLCGWTQSDKDDFDWTRHRGTTSSHGTGPDGDHTDAQGQGYYLYTESSSPRHPSDTADLISPELPANTAVCLKMFTNMYGMTVGSIDVLARGSSEPNSNQLIAHFIHATPMPVWVERTVNIPAQPSTFNVIIRGTQGTGFQGDAAIDDIIIYEGQC
ncbi:MAM domain-containing glycosylphosphatidylinositol anchor protein 1-like [Mya arenaria]|uniref:MAM domain-containing glycosylphosphatidylinositol anchor protein 1-like n=1 Tax=Mya arenaria TaxID=6604 RepID=UPI0022E81608|nr:MAM domain-containing glycosylphosphatidylinositol anchor protein 1-like [Mya arenaria]